MTLLHDDALHRIRFLLPSPRSYQHLTPIPSSPHHTRQNLISDIIRGDKLLLPRGELWKAAAKESLEFNLHFIL
ncbi:hypothetical protein E2C01_055997 [Portunus trituberculatus]|uniref:Uncharacterized protein n=1 Tax=Portunus trituberculatus TaxID=210409 RepID=A0A5B7GP08_PORTR|nr:hypothetical protein [Portunus trituberculatus]